VARSPKTHSQFDSKITFKVNVPVKIVVAPQSFKGSLSALDVSQAIAQGIRHVIPNAEIVLLPMADGGEGTVRAMVEATHGRILTAEVNGPLGGKVNAEWGILGDEKSAVIEMAAASGITLVAREKLNPLIATTFGTGELIKTALDADCRRLIIGIGGSATNDGGAGMAQALGVRFLDKNGNQLPWGGEGLVELSHIDVSGLDPRLATCQITAASDVTNPLVGKSGASWVYGPQKGASEQDCRKLDKALENYATVIKKDLGIDVKDLPGAGAAGGLGAGLVAFLGAKLRSGIEIISEAVNLKGQLQGADLVITGEGRIDGQTLFGKAVSGVASRAKALNVPVVAITGEVTGDYEECLRQGIDAILSITPGPINLKQAMDNADTFIANTAEQAVRLILIGKR
jgi:glycerate 2-kinase